MWTPDAVSSLISDAAWSIFVLMLAYFCVFK